MSSLVHRGWVVAWAMLWFGCGSAGGGSPDSPLPPDGNAIGDGGGAEDAASADGLGASADGPVAIDGGFQPRLIATFDSVTRAFDIDPRAHREPNSLTVSGARFGDDLLTLDVLDSPAVQARTYVCGSDSVYIGYVHLGVAWVARADLPCTVTFSMVPAAIAEIAEGTFDGTLVRQDGMPGTMLVENGEFEVAAEN